MAGGFDEVELSVASIEGIVALLLVVALVVTGITPGECCCWGTIFGLCVSERGLEAATTEATCLFVVETTEAVSVVNWLELERGLEGFLSGVSALRPLLCDLRLAGVRGRLALKLPANDFVPEK